MCERERERKRERGEREREGGREGGREGERQGAHSDESEIHMSMRGSDGTPARAKCAG